MDKNNFDEMNDGQNINLNYERQYERQPKKIATERVMNNLNGLIKAILIIIALAIALGTIGILIYRWTIVYDSLHVNPKKTLENKYNIRLDEVADNTDSRGNGTFTYKLKDIPELQFNALVNWSSYSDDYADNSQKYYYENWENKDKDLIQTKSSYDDNGLLSYEQYIEIDDEDSIEEAVELMYDFIKSAGDKYTKEWDLYLQVNENNRIYPFDSDDIDVEQSIDKAKEEYNNIVGKDKNSHSQNNTNIVNEISNEIINEITEQNLINNQI